MFNLFMFSFLACHLFDPFTKSPAERLIDLRSQRTELMDTLYQGYRGDSLTDERKQGTDKSKTQHKKKSGSRFLKAIQNTASELDRSRFEKHCLTIGNGGHAQIITEKAKNFFEKSEISTICREIAVMDIEISELEIKVAAGK